MKVEMVIWAGGVQSLPTWFKHQEETDISLEQIKELYDTGNNVMLWHGPDGVTVLFVDHKRFTQR